MAGPAWKRLGLKLKFADQDAPESRKRIASNGHGLTRELSSTQTLTERQEDFSQQTKKKRKTSKYESPSKGTEEVNTTSEPPSVTNRDYAKLKRPKKQVSFSSDAKANVDTPAPSTSQPQQLESKKPKAKTKSKTKTKSAKLQTFEQKSTPALDYLSQYYNARSSWKFNKNRETWLLKHIFSPVDVPRKYDIPLARYIHGLQSNNARQRLKAESEKRLRDEASTLSEEVSRQEDPGKEEEYRTRFFRNLDESVDSNRPGNVDESDEYCRWVQRHPRAEIVLWVLLGSSLPTITKDLDESSALTSRERKRKNRTAIIEYESSSSSDSTSDSTSDSEDDSSSSDDESDAS